MDGFTKIFVKISMADSDDYTIDDMIDWCDAYMFTKGAWDWEYATGSADERDVEFYFKDPKIATLFSLKWNK